MGKRSGAAQPYKCFIYGRCSTTEIPSLKRHSRHDLHRLSGRAAIKSIALRGPKRRALAELIIDASTLRRREAFYKSSAGESQEQTAIEVEIFIAKESIF